MVEREWAVVVGDGLNALGVVRSLHAVGVRVAVLARTPGAESTRSRCAAQVSYYVNQTALPQALLALVAKLGGRPVLFLTEEEAVRVVSESRDALAPLLRFRMAPHDTMLELTHKDGVQAAAERHGLQIPRAVRLRTADDLMQLDTLRFPCVLKPGYKHHGYGASFKKAYEVATSEQARMLFSDISPVLPDLIVQEWIVGGDDSIHFCLQYIGRDGTLVASFTGRKLRAWPPQVGGTASCMPAAEHHAELSALTARFFRAVGFQGMGSMEYKRDARDGRFYVVEPTVGRTDFQQEVATVNGCNLPAAAYSHEVGLPAAASAVTVPRIWREPITDRWSSQVQGVHPAVSGHLVVDAYFRWKDPVPWLALQADRVRQRLRNWTGTGRG